MKKIVYFLIACFVLLSFSQSAQAQLSVGVSITANTAPPPLPVYTQPPIPGDGYLWVPGYWNYDPTNGYYWVPGVWVMPPQTGLLWTPPYWGFVNGAYGFYPGYWGPQVGYYGGINYGFGYFGAGFVGGRWSGNVFRYNTAVWNVNRRVVHNVYNDRTVIHNTTIVNNRASFNGPRGATARVAAQQEAAARDHRIQPTAEQLSHEQGAGRNRNQFANTNHGMPGAPAMDRVNGRSFTPEGRVYNGGGGRRHR